MLTTVSLTTDHFGVSLLANWLSSSFSSVLAGFHRHSPLCRLYYRPTHANDETYIISFKNELSSLVRHFPKHDHTTIDGYINVPKGKKGKYKFYVITRGCGAIYIGRTCKRHKVNVRQRVPRGSWTCNIRAFANVRFSSESVWMWCLCGEL